MDEIEKKQFYEAYKLANKINKDKMYRIPIPKSKPREDLWNTLFEGKKIKIYNYDFDVACGNILKEFIDFNITSILKNLTLKRIYDADSKKTGLFGYGFITEYEIHKDEFINEDSKIYKEDHKLNEITFFKDHFYYTFNLQGNLKRISDKNGNYFEIRYIDSSDLIESIVTSCGRSLKFKYKDNKVESVTDNIGRIVKYFYENDFLVEVVQANSGKYRFEYDFNHKKISKVIDANKNTEIEIGYNRYGKVISIQFHKKISWKIEYDERNKSITLIDYASNLLKFIHDKANLIKEININDKDRILFEYDKKNNLISKTDKDGKKTRFSYDEFKNITMKQFFDGAWEQYFYNSEKLLLKLNKSNGYEKILSYDNRDNLIETREKIDIGFVIVKSYAHDEKGRIIKIVDGNKNIIKKVYNTENSVSPEIIEYSNGFKLYLEYDEVGRLIFENNLGVKTIYKYNNIDLLIQTIYNNGSKDFRRYDHLGNLLEVTMPKEMKISAESNRSSKNFKYLYDENYDLKEILAPNLQNIDISYLAEETPSTSNNNEDYIYNYDKNLNLIEEKYSFYDRKENSFVVKKYEYDDRNNLTRIHINSGEDRKYLYTGIDRLSKETIKINETKSHKIFYEYNSLGLLREKIELLDLDDADLETIGNIERLAARIITRFQYNENNYLVKVILPNEKYLDIEYDDCCNIIYSDQNRFLKDFSLEKKDEKNISHLYDKYHRIIKAIFENEEYELFEYDLANNISSFTNKQGFKTSYTYNSINKLKERIDEEGNKIIYLYDLSGIVSRKIFVPIDEA